MLINGKETCNCKKKNCERHGNCEECLAHHKDSKRYPVPYCMKKNASQK